ncbi:MAG: LysM peptidoglycan-binding domain-containing protein [Bacilli bacterium]|nr:LysM peptidoglycan-binding domain-containing protein [Bacilli bacterium]
MNNRLVIVDAGHGGIDSGAVGNGMLEKNLTLEISKYIYNRLKEIGIPVVMTREEDTYLPKEDRIRRVMSLSSNSTKPILIANHINAGGGEGAEVVYSLRDNDELATLVLDKIGEKGQLKRKVYQRRLPENPNKDYYYILRETGNTEPILIEYGFIDNKNDAYKLKNNLLDYAEGVVEAISQYLGYDNTEEAKEEYIVEKGDTLYSLSKRFNISIEELKRINNLNDDILSIGQVLKLSNTDDNEYDTYIVKKGDSLWAISKEYNIPLNELIKINSLTDLTLQINQELLVPKTNKNIYIVEAGDTLWSIARKNNINVEELKTINNLTSNLISVGQELIIE